MHHTVIIKIFMVMLLCCFGNIGNAVNAQARPSEKYKKASRKVEAGINKNNQDTLAQGYYDLGETYFTRGDYPKSESFFQKSKDTYEKLKDEAGIAKSSRALARVQEKQHKTKEAIDNYATAEKKTGEIGNNAAAVMNRNDIERLYYSNSPQAQANSLKKNIDISKQAKDTSEIVQGYAELAEVSLSISPDTVVESYKNAYKYSKNDPGEALKYNQLITEEYLKQHDFEKAIETKKEVLKEPFVANSTQRKANQINSLATIYISKKDDSTAIRLLTESYQISVKNGHTLEAAKSVEKLDSIFRNNEQDNRRLALYNDFFKQLPSVLSKDNTIADNRIIQETEEKIKILESEKALKDDLIRKKNTLNYWLTGSVVILALFIGIILYVVKKLQERNKKIALQSLRREMNPHFIFNSLNSINQFIAHNNELEANQYLAKFSTLMRNVMENSKEDFVLFSRELKLLENYLELEKSRFPDKFDFKITIDDSLYADEQVYIPGMLIQPHIENAVWHGLRYIGEKGFLQLGFIRRKNSIEVTIEDNGIGIEGSRKHKTTNQQQHKGRGISNTMERIRILNGLYHQRITCTVEDKPAPGHGVKVTIIVPILKNNRHED